jgi:hypothetical protein
MIPPVDPLTQACEPTPPDLTTRAVLRYLAAMRTPITSVHGLKAQVDALNDLVAICYKACQSYKRADGGQGQLYLWDPWSELSVQFNRKPQIEDHDVENNRNEDVEDNEGNDVEDNYERAPESRSGRENTKHHRLRDWIELWILRELARYLDKSDHEIQAEAAGDAIRYLARRCVLALVQEVTRSYPEDDVFPRICVSLDEPTIAADGNASSLIDAVVGTPLNDSHDLLRIVDPSSIHNCHHEFDRLGITDVLTEIIRGLRLERGDTTRNVAALSRVGKKQARNRIKRCYKTLKVNRRNPAVRALRDALLRGPNHAHYELAVEESEDTKSRRRLLSGVARERWDGISERGIKELKAEERRLERNEIEIRLEARRDSTVDLRPEDNETHEDGIEDKEDPSQE